MTQKKAALRILPHVIALLIFLLAAFVYCRPAFQHKVLVQEDMTQWRAMARSSFVYKEQHGHFPLWTESMFSGMPAYLIAMDANAFAPQYFAYDILTLHLPTPANYFFLACISMYFLVQVLRVNPYIGIIGGLAYAYATYHPVIISVGHDTKMQALAILPAFIAGLMLIYEKKYGWGAAMTALCTALIVSANHMQIFYYGLIIAAGMTLGYIVRWIKAKEWKHLAIALTLAAGCWLTGVLCNAVVIFTTYDLSKATIRGGSEMSEDAAAKSGLSNDYAFSYSLYPSESFILLAPKMYGGSSGPELTANDSRAMRSLQQLPTPVTQAVEQQELMTFYWGGIGGTAGPAYAGAIVCLLALVGMFILDNTHKWWIASTILLALLMSWGGYFSGFNGLLLKYLPMYNKFRAPSVILVIPVFLLAVLAMLSLDRLLTSGEDTWKKYKQGLLLTAGIFLVLLLFYFTFDYTTAYDRHFLRSVSSGNHQAAETFIDALRGDRRSLFLHSMARSALFLAAAAITGGLYLKGKIRSGLLLATIGVLAYVDIISIDFHYLNNDNYKPSAGSPGTQIAGTADSMILKDTGYYRVFDLRYGAGYTLGYGAATAWFHRSIGGYNAAKLSIYQDLIEHQLTGYPGCMPVLNMLNTRYLMRSGSNGDTVVRNETALGPAWLVKGIRYGATAKEVMEGLTNLDTKDTALLFGADSTLVAKEKFAAGKSVAGVDGAEASAGKSGARVDRAIANEADAGGANSGVAADSIWLVQNNNDEMVYQSSTAVSRFAVFSEVYYPRGWQAYIDGKEINILRTNYTLRGLIIPPGQHSIHFIFHPSSYYTGQAVQRIAGILTLFILISMIYIKLKYLFKPKTA